MFILLPLTPSFAAIIITAATRGRCRTRNVIVDHNNVSLYLHGGLSDEDRLDDILILIINHLCDVKNIINCTKPEFPLKDRFSNVCQSHSALINMFFLMIYNVLIR